MPPPESVYPVIGTGQGQTLNTLKMDVFNSMADTFSPQTNKQLTEGNVYFAYFRGKLIGNDGFLSSSMPTSFTRSEAVTAIRKAKQISRRKCWGRLDYIIQYKGNEKTTIHPENF